MKDNILTLYDYKDTKCHSCHHALGKQIFSWISRIIDTAVTIAIVCCTVFCCYLAWTML